MKGRAARDARPVDQDRVGPAQSRQPVKDRGAAHAAADDDGTRVRSQFNVTLKVGPSAVPGPREVPLRAGFGRLDRLGLGRVALRDEVVNGADEQDQP